MRQSASQPKRAGEPYEVIVVVDASTDRTHEIALRHGARVVPVNFRQIAATRNAGGRSAVGELLFFVDADTVVTTLAVRAAVRACGVERSVAVPRSDSTGRCRCMPQ